MLDKNTLTTLKTLCNICEDDGYKVIDYNNLIAKLPAKFKVEKDELDQNLEYLQGGKFIDIKYAENDTYCLCILPKARVILEDETLENKTILRANKMLVLTMFASGLMAFLGAFLAVWLFK